MPPTTTTPTRADIFDAISAERARQITLWTRDHAHGHGDCSSPDVPTAVKVTILLEEAGEVARAFLDGDGDRMRTELTQLGAVVVAILESETLP